jgi:IS605 OrfB family transposase
VIVDTNKIDPLDDLEDPFIPVSTFEYKEYKKPFELWDCDEYLDPDGIYQPIHFAVDATYEQHAILIAMRAAYSKELVLTCSEIINFYRNNPRPQKAPKAEKEAKKSKKAGKDVKPVKKEKKNRALIFWKKLHNDFFNAKKQDLTGKGWAGRAANTIIEQAQAKLSSYDKCCKRHLLSAQLRHKDNPTNFSHIKLQHWEAHQNYSHFCLGDKRVVVEIQKYKVKIEELQKTKQTDHVAKQLVNLKEFKQLAVEKWHESRLFPIIVVGSGGADGGKWMNKTIFLQNKKGYPGEYEFVVKYPKFLGPNKKGRFLPQMVFPVKLNQRSLEYWRKALSNNRCLTFSIMPQKGNRWRVTGVFKEEKVAKFEVQNGKRIGIDQNAGFIAVALIDGKKLRWVKKFQISQKGSTESHESRIYDVMKKVCELAQKEKAVIVIEDLRLVDKHKQFASKKVRRHIQRIPYRKLQEILGRLCSRKGATLKQVNPAYTSILGRYRLPGMQVHLAAAAMIAWRDIGCDQIQIFQIGDNCLKFQGEDSPIVVEVLEGMPYIQRNVSDPRFLAALYKHVKGEIAKTHCDCKVSGANGKNRIGVSTVSNHTHESESQITGFGRRTSHDQTCPAAGIGPKLRVILKPQRTPITAKSEPKTVAFTA